jgi:ATP-binding protein involved in chromosome partitioning
MLGATGPVAVDERGAHPATGRGGVRVFSTDLLLDEGAPLRWREPGSERFVWRGTLETGALREFLADVAWGPLDLLLVDLPPGTDRLHDLAELVPGLAGVVAVTIPSEESRRAVSRAMRAAVDAGLPILGVVQNMSGYACPGCGAVHSLFPGGAGTALAAEFRVPLLGHIPFSPGERPAAVPPGLADALRAVVT